MTLPACWGRQAATVDAVVAAAAAAAVAVAAGAAAAAADPSGSCEAKACGLGAGMVAVLACFRGATALWIVSTASCR